MAQLAGEEDISILTVQELRQFLGRRLGIPREANQTKAALLAHIQTNASQDDLCVLRNAAKDKRMEKQGRAEERSWKRKQPVSLSSRRVATKFEEEEADLEVEVRDINRLFFGFALKSF